MDEQQQRQFDQLKALGEARGFTVTPLAQPDGSVKIRWERQGRFVAHTRLSSSLELPNEKNGEESR